MTPTSSKQTLVDPDLKLQLDMTVVSYRGKIVVNFTSNLQMKSSFYLVGLHAESTLDGTAMYAPLLAKPLTSMHSMKFEL